MSRAGSPEPQGEFDDRIHCDQNADLEYRDERAGAGMSELRLLIRPTHRLVSDSPGLNGDRLAAASAPQFAVGQAGRGELGCREPRGHIQAAAGQDVLGLGTAAAGHWRVARLRCDATPDRFVPDHGPG
jgi:hypothetical protein